MYLNLQIFGPPARDSVSPYGFSLTPDPCPTPPHLPAACGPSPPNCKAAGHWGFRHRCSPLMWSHLPPSRSPRGWVGSSLRVVSRWGSSRWLLTVEGLVARESWAIFRVLWVMDETWATSPDFCPGPPTGLHLLPFHSEPRGYVCASVHSALDVPCPGVTHAFPPGMLPGSRVTRGVRRGGRLVGCTPSRCLLLQFEVEWRRLKTILFSPF